MRHSSSSLFGLARPTFDPRTTLVTSWALPPRVLACVRLVLALYTLLIALFNLVWQAVREHTASSYFSYFTDLSYIGLCAYLWAAAVQTIAFAFFSSGTTTTTTTERKRKSSGGTSVTTEPERREELPGYPLQRWPTVFQFLHMMLLATVTTFPILVTIVYWALLASPFATTEAAWTGISQHAFNTVFCLFEILFTNIPPLYWGYLPICILFLGCYLGVAYITYAKQGFYTYSFLDPATEHAKLAAYIIGIAVAEIIIFVIVRYVIVLRTYLVRRRTGIQNQDEGEHGRQELEEWEEVEGVADISTST